MQTSFYVMFLVLANLRVLSNVRQVLKYYRGTCGGRSDYLFGEDMIAIPVESRLPLAHLFQVALSGFRSFGLQFTTQAKSATINLFPMRSTQEVTVRGHGRSIESQINPDYFRVLLNLRFSNIDHDMQPPFPLEENEVGSCDLPSCILK